MTNEEREALIAQGWTPPVAVDPDLAEAETVWCEFNGPNSDGRASVDLAFAGIKRGRELAAAENERLKETISGHLRHINNLRAMVGRLKRELYGDGPDIGDNPCPY